MWTIGYADGWIHGYTHTDSVRVQYADGTCRTARSLRAAKCMLTRAARR